MELMEGGEGIVMQIEGNGKVPKDWILLDNQSTVDVFCNKSCYAISASIPTQWTFTVTLGLPVQNLSANSADTILCGTILQALQTFSHWQKPRNGDTE
jgi:hypothetical protein